LRDPPTYKAVIAHFNRASTLENGIIALEFFEADITIVK
jgi:hypothetical protein